MKAELEPRPVSASRTIVSQLMLPSDANPEGNVHGGVIMKLVDTVGGVVARRHSRSRVVTARMDEMSFLHPVFVGDLVTLKGSLNDVGRTSMEVGVRVESENLRSGLVTHTGSAYVVYVALDDRGSPVEVPGVLPESEEDRARMEAARMRREHRKRSGRAMI